MIARYTHPEMGAVWSDQHRYETWLLVETAAAEACAEAGIVPEEAARDIRARGGFDIARIEEIEKTTQHDVIGRDRYGAGPPDARSVRSHPEGSRGAGGRAPRARIRASPDADDRPHP